MKKEMKRKIKALLNRPSERPMYDYNVAVVKDNGVVVIEHRHNPTPYENIAGLFQAYFIVVLGLGVARVILDLMGVVL